MSKVKSVTFFGYAGSHEEDSEWKDAYEISKLIADKGYRIVDGGGPGIMQAVTDGAESIEETRKQDVDTTAIYYRPQSSTMFEGAAPLNITDHKEYFADYIERTMKLIELGDVYFIFNGGTGTFSELGMVWGLARLYYGHHKPLILVGTFWNEVMNAITKNMRIREEEKRVFRIANNAEEAIKIFDELVEEIEGREPYKATLDEAKYVI